MDKPLMKITEAAAIMGVAVNTLGAGLIQGLYPFGNATKGKRDSYRYIIFRARFEKYLNGEDMSIDQGGDPADNNGDETLITVVEAAKLLGISSTTLTAGLKQNLYPFGNATEKIKKVEHRGRYNRWLVKNNSRWRYIIFRKRLEVYLHAGNMKFVPAGWEQTDHIAVLKANGSDETEYHVLCNRRTKELTESEIKVETQRFFDKKREEIRIAELERERNLTQGDRTSK
jgi:hypothetical protein